MLYQIRAATARRTHRRPDAHHQRRRRHPPPPDDIRIAPAGKWQFAAQPRHVSMDGRIAVPKFGIELVLQPLLRDQELVTRSSTHVTYWEGASTSAGVSATSPRGEGYVR